MLLATVAGVFFIPLLYVAVQGTAEKLAKRSGRPVADASLAGKGSSLPEPG
jgi:hypothetical protein